MISDGYSVAAAGQPARIAGFLYVAFFEHHLLFLIYLACFTVVAFSNDILAAQYLFELAFIPLALLSFFSIVLFRPTKPYVTSLVGSLPPLGLIFGRSIVFWAFVVYLLAITLATVEQTWPSVNDQFDVILPLEILFFVAMTAYLSNRYLGFIKALFLFGGLILAASAVLNMVLYALDPDAPNPGRLTPLVGFPGNQVATTIALTYGVFLIGLLTTTDWPAAGTLRRLAITVSGAVLLGAMVWTQSRGAMLGTLAGAFVCGFHRMSLRAFWMLVVLACLAAVALIVLVPAVNQSLVGRGGNYRPEVWSKYLAMASERPLLGYGQRASIQVTMSSGAVIDHPHNLVLSGEIMGGVFGGASMLVLILGGLYWGWVSAARGRSATTLGILAVIAVAGLTDYALVVSPPNWYWITFWLPIGLAIGSEISARRMSGGSAILAHADPTDAPAEAARL